MYDAAELVQKVLNLCFKIYQPNVTVWSSARPIHHPDIYGPFFYQQIDYSDILGLLQSPRQIVGEYVLICGLGSIAYAFLLTHNSQLFQST